MVVLEIAALIVGLAVVSYSSGKTVEFSTHLAAAFKIPPLIIGLFLVSVGTDIPEITHSIFSSYSGHGDINVGNTLGSSLSQVSLIFALIVIIGGVVKAHRQNIIVLGGAAVVAVAAAAIAVMDGDLSRIDAIFLILTYVILLITSARFSKKEIGSAKTDIFCLKYKKTHCMAYLLLAIIGVVIGALLVVESVVKLSLGVGLPEYFISFFVVGIGTSLPELSVGLAALKRKQYGIVIGDLMGSNIADATLALGIGPLLFPTEVSATVVLPLAIYVILASIVIVALFAWRGKIDKIAALVLLAIYLFSFIFVALNPS